MQLGRAQPLRTASELNTGVTCSLSTSMFIPYKTHLILSGFHDFAEVASIRLQLIFNTICHSEGENPIINSITTRKYPQFPFLRSILNNQTNATQLVALDSIIPFVQFSKTITCTLTIPETKSFAVYSYSRLAHTVLLGQTHDLGVFTKYMPKFIFSFIFSRIGRLYLIPPIFTLHFTAVIALPDIIF